MIRRDIRLPDGAAGWMLISQVEHARVSAELAAHCNAPLPSAERAGTIPPPANVRDLVVAAIRHHDDGWLEWEQYPQLNLDGRPLSFTEIAHAAAIEIWSRSIDAAAQIGPLAAWMVAGHFLRLARSFATAPAEPELMRWLAEADDRGAALLADWLALDPQNHTRDLADEAFQWLWTFDEVSLWLCCTCMASEPIPCAPQPYRAGRRTSVEMELTVVGVESAVAQPWRFDQPSLDFAISGVLVPAKRYHSPAELLAAGRPHTLRWRLSQA